MVESGIPSSEFPDLFPYRRVDELLQKGKSQIGALLQGSSAPAHRG